MKLRLVVGMISLICCAKSVSADYGVNIAYGNGTKNVHDIRLSLQRSWGYCFTPNLNKFNGYWELAFQHMTGHQVFEYPTNSNLQSVSASVAIRFQKHTGLNLFLDLALGVAYMSKDEISSRDLGSNLVFEDRAGFGVLFGPKKQIEVGCRLIHYSNAYLASENHGLNLHLLEVGYWFN